VLLRQRQPQLERARGWQSSTVRYLHDSEVSQSNRGKSLESGQSKYS
jgi:hypothetical protein